MKTYLLLFALLLSHTLIAQSSWKPLGGNGGLVSDPASARSAGAKIATDTSGVPYIAYFDISDSLRLMIKKFDGTNWVNVGNLGYHLRGEIDASIVVSPNDTLYVGYYNLNDSSKYSVIKFDGTDWVQVGSSIKQDPGMYFEVSLAVDSNEKLYFGYGAYSYSSNPPGKADILTYDGTDWVPVGNTDFVQYTGRMSLRMGLNNELYAGYNTYYLTGHTATSSRVQKWDGSKWDTVGAGFQYITNIDVAPDGTVYTLHEGATSGSGWYAVEKLVNNVWVQQGSTGIGLYGWELKIDKQGTPYISFAEANNNGGNVSVKKYDGTNWNYVGSQAFTNHSSISEVRMTFGKDNLPFITYQTNATLNEKVYSWYYNSIVTNIPKIEAEKIINIYPNPAYPGEPVTIESPYFPKGEYKIIIYNSLGQAVKEKRCLHEGGSASIPVTIEKNIMPGIYHLSMHNGQAQWNASIVIE